MHTRRRTDETSGELQRQLAIDYIENIRDGAERGEFTPTGEESGEFTPTTTPPEVDWSDKAEVDTMEAMQREALRRAVMGEGNADSPGRESV